MTEKFPNTLLIPTAGSLPARERGEYLVDIAKRLRSRILAVHVVEEGASPMKVSDGEEALQILKEYADRAGVPIETYTLRGDILKNLVEFARDKGVDLILVGSSEGRIIADWIRKDLVKTSPVPVVIVPYDFSLLI
ncbi:MAG: universal stress protein [Thermoplasmata archaeon]|nr:universal stress protein [Thermoplasmata archaeon]